MNVRSGRVKTGEDDGISDDVDERREDDNGSEEDEGQFDGGPWQRYSDVQQAFCSFTFLKSSKVGTP